MSVAFNITPLTHYTINLFFSVVNHLNQMILAYKFLFTILIISITKVINKTLLVIHNKLIIIITFLKNWIRSQSTSTANSS